MLAPPSRKGETKSFPARESGGCNEPVSGSPAAEVSAKGAKHPDLDEVFYTLPRGGGQSKGGNGPLHGGPPSHDVQTVPEIPTAISMAGVRRPVHDGGSCIGGRCVEWL